MTHSIFYTTFFFFIFLASCAAPDDVLIESPDGEYRFELQLENGRPFYRVSYKETEIIGPSALGFELADARLLPGEATFRSIEKKSEDTTWQPVYGERAQYPDRYREDLISFANEDDQAADLRLRVRAYDEGIAFRYELAPSLPVTITRELTEFTLPPSSQLWVSKRAQSPIEQVEITSLKDTVERPLLAQLEDSLFVALGEAALVDFARMKLALHPDNPAALTAQLEGEVKFDGAFTSPWRTIMAGETAGQLLENNYLFLNLNEPNQISETNWIKPGKVIREVTLTTQGGEACVDFAVKHNLQYIEFDAGWYGAEGADTSDATTITVDPKRSKGPLDLQEVIKYADSQGVGVLLYLNRRVLEKQSDEVFPLVSGWGVRGVKFGFVQVGSQQWTSWLHREVRKAADYRLMVDIHDEYRPTGYSRTYPNLMTQEGIRGDEESPGNAMVLKTLFTRMLAGAGDHTNCYFAARVDETMGSHASQLAKAVCIYSPWQFLYWYDRPESSPSRTGGAGDNDRFIQDVPELAFFDQLPTIWDDTRVIEGYPGAYAVVARRSGTSWFVGALNGDQERAFTIPLDFLDPNYSYQAQLFTDDLSFPTPTKVAVKESQVSSQATVSETLKANKGLAMIIRQNK